MNHNAYINPKILFRGKQGSETIHVNPNFPRPRGQKVYINPLFASLSGISTKASLPATNSKLPTPKSCQTSSKYSWKRRLSNQNLETIAKPETSKQAAVYLSSSGKKLVRKNTTVNSKVGPAGRYGTPKRLARTQFKLDKRPSSQRRRSAIKKKFVATKSRYKIERLFPKNVYVSPQNTVRSRNFKELTKRNASANKKLVSIGGILYRASSNKLTRTTAEVREPRKAVTVPESKAKRGAKNLVKHVINIRGESFLLSRNGATLRRLPAAAASPPTVRLRQRVDFGGVTYCLPSAGDAGDVLVRTNSHRARHLLTAARHRSIACLAARRRKINVPCTVFRHLGRCRRLESGVCPFTHDKKNVDLCKRFLKGECSDSACLLSHNMVHQKVATCRYYLEGSCFRDKCPYLHVKLSGKAAICTAFLNGYCELGQQCSLRHVNICPVFEKTGSCIKGRRCPYPHKRPNNRKGVKKIKTRSKAQNQSQRDEKGQQKNPEGGGGKRYYAPSPLPGPSTPKLPNIVREKRPLPTLPSFIAFETN